MNESARGWEKTLPGGLPGDVLSEIGRFVDRLPENSSCLATGSIIEGIGNANSDIDLYVVNDSDSSAASPVSIGIRGSRYVDCEYIEASALSQLLNRFAQDTGELSDLSLRDFDRYYRIAVAARLVVTDSVAPLLSEFSVERSRELFTRRSLLFARDLLAKARVAHAIGNPRESVVYLREAASWRATSLLSGAGEGYPKLKWVTVKAERVFGRGSAQYDDCLRGVWATPEDLEGTLAWIGGELGAVLYGPSAPIGWALGEGVTVVPEEPGPYLIRGRRSIARTTGAVGRIVALLDAGAVWEQAVAELSEQWSIDPWDINVSLRADADELARSGYLVAQERS